MQGRKELVTSWSSKLPPLGQAKRSRFDITIPAQIIGDQMDDLGRGAVATPQQQYTALIILGLIGAEFSKPQTSRRPSMTEFEMMDDTVARQTARSLQNVLIDTKPSLNTNLRRSAIDLIGRGFHLWEKYLNVPLVLMGLLDLAILSKTPSQHLDDGDSEGRAKSLTSSLAHKALITMVMAHPSSIISVLAKEVSKFLANSHTTHHPHSSFPLQIGVNVPPSTPGIVTPANKLLAEAKSDIFILIEAIIDKCMQKVTLQLVEVVDILLFCIDTERLKKERYLMDNFPVFKKSVNCCCNVVINNIAQVTHRELLYEEQVFGSGGSVGKSCHLRSEALQVSCEWVTRCYEMRLFHVMLQMLNAHRYAITTLNFSDDGKMLATYAYGDSTLSIWLVRILYCDKLYNSYSYLYIRDIFILLNRVNTVFIGMAEFQNEVTKYFNKCLYSGV